MITFRAEVDKDNIAKMMDNFEEKNFNSYHFKLEKREGMIRAFCFATIDELKEQKVLSTFLGWRRMITSSMDEKTIAVEKVKDILWNIPSDLVDNPKLIDEIINRVEELSS